MELTAESEPSFILQSINIIEYCPCLHHAQIPLIYAESFEDVPWEDNWDQFDGFDPKGVSLAEDSETKKLAGYILSFKKRDFGYISVVGVIPSYRKRGIATALVKNAVQYLKSRGLSPIIIDVETANMPALRVYEKVGFRIIETIED